MNNKINIINICRCKTLNRHHRNGNILPSTREALNFNNLKNFTLTEDGSKILFQKIATNFICD